MTDSASPFEDPEFREMLARSGIVHRPGMANELMQDLAPLLAADGFDLEQIDELDIDQFNAAMSRAVERRNLELVTPVGDERARTINTLRQIAQAVHGGTPSAVDKILDKLQPDPTKHRPSFGHVMGVAMETLDAWHTAKQYRSALRKMPLQHLHADTKNVAAEVHALARKGRAFRSLEALMRKANGLVVAEAGAYLVAASVEAVCTTRNAAFQVVLDEMLPQAKLSAGFAKGSAFGQAAVEQVSSKEYLRKFGAWLAEHVEQTGIEAAELQPFERLASLAQDEGFDPHDPDDFEHWIDIIMDFDNPVTLDWGLTILHEYVHFRTNLDDDPESWEEPHGLIIEAADEGVGMPLDFAKALHHAQNISPEQRHDAVNALPVVSGILKLRDWLDKPQPITSSGVPKRADIETVAAMIGVTAQGVAKLPDDAQHPNLVHFGDLFSDPQQDQADLDLPQLPDQELPETRYVLSALALPELMAWWWTLEAQGFLGLTSTRVQLSPLARELLASDSVPLEDAELVIAGVVEQLLTSALERSPFEVPAVGYAMRQIMDSISGKTDMPSIDGLGTGFIEIVAERHMRQLAVVGLLELRDGKPVVPETLRAPLVYGLLMVSQHLSEVVSSSDHVPE